MIHKITDLFVFCLLFIGFILFYPHIINILPLDLSLATSFLIQTLVLIFVWYQTIRRFEFQWKLHRSQKITLAFGAFVILSLVGVCHSVYHYESVRLWTILLTGFLIYLTTGNFQLKVLHEPEIELEFPQRKYRNSLLWMIFIFGVLESIYGIYQFNHGFAQQMDVLKANPTMMDPRIYSGMKFTLESKRIIGTFGNPNLYAIVLAMIVPLTLGLLFIQKSTLHKLLLTLGLALFVFCIALSASKGGFIALIVGVVIFLALSGFNEIQKNKTWVGITLLLSILVVFYSQTLMTKNSDQSLISRSLNSTSTMQERFQYWKIALHMIKESPIIGNGLGSYGILYGQYKPVEIGESRYAHNLFLQTWAETGIVGIIALLYFVFMVLTYPFSRFKKLIRPEVKLQCIAYYAALLVFLVDCFIGFGAYWPEIFYLVCILLGGFYAACNAESVPEPSPTDILWRRQPNTQFLLITPGVTIAILLFVYFWLYPSFRGELAFQKGGIDLEMQQVNESLHSFTNAIKYIPSNSEYQLHLGSTLIHDNQVEKGISHLIKAAELNSHTAYYHQSLAQAYRTIGKLDSAVDEYKKAIACYPNKFIYHYELAQLYQEMKNPTLAMEEHQAAEYIKSHQR